MKKTIGIMGGDCFVLTNAYLYSAQDNTWDAKKNPTVEAITSQYEGKYS